MGIELQWDVILAFAAGIVLLFIFAKVFLAPIKLILKLIINSVIGGILLWLINLLGANIGLTITINPITALIAGVLGIPGVILLLILKLVFHI